MQQNYTLKGNFSLLKKRGNLRRGHSIYVRELEQRLRQAKKYGRMISSDMLVEGREYLAAVACQACGKLPTAPKYIKTCTSCNANICKWCQIATDAEIDDCVFDRDLEMQGQCQSEIDEEEINSFDKCPVCRDAYQLTSSKKNRTLINKAMRKMRFKCGSGCCQEEPST